MILQNMKKFSFHHPSRTLVNEKMELTKIKDILEKAKTTNNVNHVWFHVQEATEIRNSIRVKHVKNPKEPYRIVDEAYCAHVDEHMNQLITIYLDMVEL